MCMESQWDMVAPNHHDLERVRPRSSLRPTEARLEAGGWRLEVEQADITDDFSALDDPVWGAVFKLDGTMTEASVY